VHPIPKRLPGHAGKTGRLLARHAFQRMRQREQTRAHTPVPLATGKPAQRDRAEIGSDRQG
jgi:hypothetical protein